MKQAFNKLTEIIKNEDYTTREAVLSGIILFLLGIIIGAVLSPKKNTEVGCNNGNNNTGSLEGGATKEKEKKK